MYITFTVFSPCISIQWVKYMHVHTKERFIIFVNKMPIYPKYVSIFNSKAGVIFCDHSMFIRVRQLALIEYYDLLNKPYIYFIFYQNKARRGKWEPKIVPCIWLPYVFSLREAEFILSLSLMSVKIKPAEWLCCTFSSKRAPSHVSQCWDISCALWEWSRRDAKLSALCPISGCVLSGFFYYWQH